MDKEEIEKVVPLVDCTCAIPEEPHQKINVVRILGEGSQGTVALCHYEDLKANMISTAGDKMDTKESLTDGVFVVKVFEHIKKSNEVIEVRDVRL